MMNPAKWIRFNTIALMVIGSVGLIETLIMPVLILTTDQDRSMDSGLHFWDFSYPLIRVFYFTAAVLYLLRKPNGLRLMLLALSVTLAHGFLLRILFHNGLDMPGNAVPSLTGLVLNALLLIGVYRFRREYLMNKEELITQYGSPKSLSAPALAAVSLSGLLFLLVPVILTLLWSRATEAGSTQAERVAIYDAYFPEALRQPYMLTGIGLLSCLLGVILSGLGSGSKAGAWRIMNIPVLILCCMFMLMFLFQMM